MPARWIPVMKHIFRHRTNQLQATCAPPEIAHRSSGPGRDRRLATQNWTGTWQKACCRCPAIASGLFAVTHAVVVSDDEAAEFFDTLRERSAPLIYAAAWSTPTPRRAHRFRATSSASRWSRADGTARSTPRIRCP